MLRILITFILFLVLFAGVTLLLLQKPGFAIFNYGEFYIEIPLVKFSAAVFSFIAILYALYKLLSLIYSAPSRIQFIATRKKDKKALIDTKEGLTKYILGDWSGSIKLLLRGAHKTNKACINYIWAARAAHHAGDYEARDEYLGNAKDCTPSALPAINVLKAELLLAQGLPEQALASLNQQYDEFTSNPKIAKLIALAYLKLNDWDKLFELLPRLKPSASLNEHAIEDIKKQTALGLLKKNKQKHPSLSIEDISARFEDIIFSSDELIIAYIETLRASNRYEKASSLIINLVDKKWNSNLVHQFGLLQFKDPNKALKRAEKWVTHHTDDAYLYLTLGRLCKHAKLWGKSKAYFESSLSRKPLAETYAELAILHEQLNELKEANRCTKKGLMLAAKIN